MITIKTPEEIRIMAEGGKILAAVMKELEKAVKPGIKTKDLEGLAEGLILKFKAEPAFKGYNAPDDASSQPYPAALCVCINEEIVHCLPSERILEEGDIVSLDLGLKWKGFYSDMAVTLPVGKISPEIQRLLRVTKKSLKRGLKKVRPGNTFGDIGNTIQRYVEGQGYSIIRDLCGHGIGRNLHEEPQIFNFGQRHKGEKLEEGMVICLEPMISVGDWRIKESGDGFGWKTADNSLCAHFEHTVAITKDGYRILTESE